MRAMSAPRVLTSDAAMPSTTDAAEQSRNTLSVISPVIMDSSTELFLPSVFLQRRQQMFQVARAV